MHNTCDDRHPILPSPRRGFAWMAGAAFLVVLFSACAGEPAQTAAPTEEPTATPPPTPTQTEIPPTPTPVPTPTPIPTPDYEDLSSLASFAVDSPEGTFELYLRDSIAQQISLQREKIDIRIRYQNPSTLLQDAGGLIINVELIQDRSKRTILRESSATFEVDIDIRITFANLDTNSQTCTFTVNLEKVGELWYVVSPREFPLFFSC